MRKTVALVFTLLSISLILGAQNVRFSVLANPHIAWLTSNKDAVSPSGSILGLNTGLELDMFFAENYAFTAGLSLSSLGGNLIYEDSASISSDGAEFMVNSMKYRMQYLSIPIGLKFKSVEIGYFTIWVNPGLTPMFKLKAQGFFDGEEDKQNVSDEIGLLNINYFIEAGIEYSLGGNTALIGGLGYYSGFMDVTNHSNDKITTGTVGLVLGIMF